jgi:hypothetical protein
MPPLEPWLKRLLVAWAASTVTTGAVLSTAENRYRPKKATSKKLRGRRRRRRITPRPPVLLGTVAKADAAEGYQPSLTWADWFARVRQRSARLWQLVGGRRPDTPVDGADHTNDAKDADAVATKATKQGSRPRGAKGTRRKRRSKQSSSPTRRRQRQASLYESAKESLRQVVKEEAEKAVEQTVEDAGLGKARDALKTATEVVGKTAATVADKVKESIPEDFDERAKTAGRSIVAGAKRAMQKLGESLQARDAERLSPDASPRTPPSPPTATSSSTTVPEPVAGGPTEAASTDPIAGYEGAPPDDGRVDALLATMAVLDLRAPEVNVEPRTPEPSDPSSTGPAAATPTLEQPTAATAPGPAGPLASTRGASGIELDVVAEKVGDGVQRLGAFLSGPGNPGYGAGSRRPRQAVGDVVDARDPPASSAAPTTTTTTTPDG